jgi:hypothetical protein
MPGVSAPMPPPAKPLHWPGFGTLGRFPRIIRSGVAPACHKLWPIRRFPNARDGALPLIAAMLG